MLALGARMSEPLKVLFLLEDLCYGGTQKQSVALASRLNREKFSPLVVTLTGPTDLDEETAKSGVPICHLGKSRAIAPLFFARLGKVIKKLSPDILVPCTALPNIWGRIWGKLNGVPAIVGTCRGGGAPSRQWERFLWRLSDRIVCNSRASIDAMSAKGVPLDRMIYIPNGIDSEKFAPDPEAKKPGLIVCVARLAEDKDHASLIGAFGKIAKDAPDARLKLVGEGPLQEKLVNFARETLPPKISERVEFVGASAEPEKYYREASIFALSSVREGQPNAILEAMSSGLPICATSVGGVPDMTENNVDALLSPPGDADALAANLSLLLKNPEKGAAMGAAGRRKIATNFSYKAMVDAHEKLFAEVWLASRNKGRIK